MFHIFLSCRYFKVLTERLFKKFFNPVFMFDCFYKLTEGYQKEKRFRSLFYDFIDRLLPNDGHKNSTNLYIDHFNTIRGTMSHEEIKENLLMFLGAGFETTGTVIAAVLLLLAMNPEAQEKVVEEAKDVVGSEDNEVDETKMDELKYLETVIKEAMRLFPVALLQPRTVKAEVQLGNEIFLRFKHKVIEIFSIRLQRTTKFQLGRLSS